MIVHTCAQSYFASAIEIAVSLRSYFTYCCVRFPLRRVNGYGGLLSRSEVRSRMDTDEGGFLPHFFLTFVATVRPAHNRAVCQRSTAQIIPNRRAQGQACGGRKTVKCHKCRGLGHYVAPFAVGRGGMDSARKAVLDNRRQRRRRKT